MQDHGHVFGRVDEDSERARRVRAKPLDSPFITPALSRSFSLLGWSIVVSVVGFGGLHLLERLVSRALHRHVPFELSVVVALVVVGMGFTATGFALTSMLRSLASPEHLSLRSVARALFSSFVALMGFTAAFVIFGVMLRGRQIRIRGRAVLPRVVPGDGWLDARRTMHAVDAEATVEGSLPADWALRRELALAWRENGRTEHASVAAFARLTLDLMALGAPSAMIRAAQRDALDETRHAELCFSLARDLDGAAEGPSAFPEANDARALPSHRGLALSMLAIDSLIDGSVNEGFSARVVAQLAKTCPVPRIRDVLKEIASDEGRHAAHGWDVVVWCVETGGAPVRDALRGAARALAQNTKRTTKAAEQTSARDGAWERYGIPSAALEAEAFDRTRADVLARLDRLLASTTPLAA